MLVAVDRVNPDYKSKDMHSKREQHINVYTLILVLWFNIRSYSNKYNRCEQKVYNRSTHTSLILTYGTRLMYRTIVAEDEKDF